MEFFAAYRNLNTRQYALLITSLLFVAGGLFYALPRLASSFLAAPKEIYTPVSLASPLISYGKSLPKCNMWAASKSAQYQVVIPRALKLSESPPISFRLELNRDFQTQCIGTGDSPRVSAKAQLLSPAFEIEPKLAEEKEVSSLAQWNWIISPKKPGKHSLLLQASGQKGFTVDLSGLPRSDLVSNKSSETIEIALEVLTDLGLTSTQEALLKAIGAVVGGVGVILGYPFFKDRLIRTTARVQSRKTSRTNKT